MTLFHLPQQVSVRDWFRSTASVAEDAPMPWGLRLRINHPAHQIRLTLSWRAAAALGTLLVGILLGTLLLGMQHQRGLLLSALSTEQVRALPAQAQVLEVRTPVAPTHP